MGRQLRNHNRWFFLLLGFLSGCSTVKYIAQATHGQFELVNKSRPIEEVLADERTPPKISRLLAEIPKIKDFGEKSGLKKSRNYEKYVKLDRDYVVWVVAASERLEFKPRVWSFPIVGSFNYLGWFSKSGAMGLAKKLKDEELDVYVRGAGAFSSLGWFQDPVLSTMIPKGQEAYGSVVNVILHESVHATIYIYGQSYFNESIAVFVADKLTEAYLDQSIGKTHQEANAYFNLMKKGNGRRDVMSVAYTQLKKLFDSNDSNEVKVDKKKVIYKKLRKDLKYPEKAVLNNARLIQYRTYGVGLKEFESLFEVCGKEWPRFWKKMRVLKEDSFPKAQLEDLGKVLNPIIDKGC